MPMNEILSRYDSFDNQTGGHQKLQGVRCMITDQVGHLFKYIEESNRGENEETFYRNVFSDRDFLLLRSIVPKYYGVMDVIQDQQKLKYLKIENILHGLDNPNIVDIKIGKITYDPFATVEKVKREQSKYTAQKDIGFRLSGLKVYDSTERFYQTFSGSLFRLCTCFQSPQEKSIGYLKKFLGLCSINLDSNVPNDCSNLPNDCTQCKYLRRLAIKHLLEHFIEELENVCKIVKKLDRITFYASSVLLAYDTKKLDLLCRCNIHRGKHASHNTVHTPKLMMKNSNHQCTGNVPTDSGMNLKEKEKLNNLKEFALNNISECHSKIEFCRTMHVPYNIRMIDFGHTFIDLFPGKKDENYLFGLENLVEYFQLILGKI